MSDIPHNTQGTVDLSVKDFFKSLTREHRILLFGDTNHLSPKVQMFLRNSDRFLSALKEAGVPTMAFEISKERNGFAEQLLNDTPPEVFESRKGRMEIAGKLKEMLKQDPSLSKSEMPEFITALSSVGLAMSVRSNGLKIACVDTNNKRQVEEVLQRQGIDEETARQASKHYSPGIFYPAPISNITNAIISVAHPAAASVLLPNVEAILLNRAQDNHEIADNIREVANRDGGVAVMFGAGHMRCPPVKNEKGEEERVGLQHLLANDGATYIDVFAGKKEKWLEDINRRLENGYTPWKGHNPIPFSEASLPEYVMCLKGDGKDGLDIIHAKTALEAYRAAHREHSPPELSPPWIERLSTENRSDIPRNR